MLVHIVADHHVRRGAAGHQSGQAGQNLFQGVGVQPVVAVHYLIVQAGGVADALIDALTVAAVLLMDGLDDGGIFGGVLVADGGVSSFTEPSSTRMISACSPAESRVSTQWRIYAAEL